MPENSQHFCNSEMPLASEKKIWKLYYTVLRLCVSWKHMFIFHGQIKVFPNINVSAAKNPGYWQN